MPKNSGMKKSFVKKVQQIVRDEVREEIEEKVAVIGQTNVTVSTPSIPNGDVSASDNFIRLFPLIQQGTGQYNKRIGNEIRLKHLDIKMLLNYASGDGGSDTTYSDQSVGVRVMIIRQKDNNDMIGAIEDFQGNKLLENGAILVPGPAKFSGTTFNLLQKVNREQFSVRYDKTFYLDRSKKFNETSTQLQFNRPPRPTVMSHRLSFGKAGLKLTFGDDASEVPTNFPYIMCMGYASCIDTAPPSDNLIEYSFTANSTYSDS